MKRLGSVYAIVIALLGLACGAGAAGIGHPAAAPSSTHLFTTPGCVQMTSPRLVVLVQGLVALALKPSGAGVVEQEDAILALVEAYQGLSDPCPVGRHVAKLECSANCRLEGPSGMKTSLDLANSEIEFPFHSSQMVKVHRESLVGSMPDPSRDACSLRWLPSASQMTSHSLRSAVFGRPDPALVTSRIVFGAGEIFTHDFWLKPDASGDPCSFTIPNSGGPRAMASTVGIVVPMPSRQVPFRRTPHDGFAEDWWVEAVTAGQDVVVTLTNHPVSTASTKHDFTGHFRFLDGTHANCTAAPRFQSSDCPTGTPGLDPQCTPSESQWP